MLIASTTWRIPSSEQITAWRRVCIDTPLRASIRMIAASEFEAPVAMLRVYCSCPGVSAMMKEHRSVAKIPVGDVDGDALLALRLQPIEQQGEIDVSPVVP